MSREFFGRPAAVHMIVRRDDKLVFLKRLGPWRTGKFCLPGGHVEKGEPIRQAAQRELKEETGLDVPIQDFEMIHMVHRAPDHDGDAEYIDCYFVVNNVSGEPVNAEPDTHSEIAWFDINDSDPDIFVDYTYATLKAIEEGKFYSELGW